MFKLSNYFKWNREVLPNSIQTYESQKDPVVADEIIFHNGIRYFVVQRRTTQGENYVEVETTEKNVKKRIKANSVDGLEELVRSTGFKGEVR